jgi:MFS family permease
MKFLNRKTAIVIAAVFLLFQFCLQVYLSKSDAQTTDESVHIYSGYRQIKYGDFHYNTEHPPFIKTFTAIPLLFLKLNDPISYNDYINSLKPPFYFNDHGQHKVGEDFLYNSGNDADQILFWTRFFASIFTLLLGLVIFIIASYVWGYGGGILSLLFYVLDPTLTAHGHLITTDIGYAFGIITTLASFWLFLQKPTYGRAMLIGLFLGTALIIKFSAIILLPILFILTLVTFKRFNLQIWSWKELWSKILVAGLLAWFVIFVGYQFQLNFIPPFNLQENLGNEQIKDLFNNIRYIFIPGSYFSGLFAFLNHAAYGHSAYLMGEHSPDGWWYYFPLGFVVKSGVATLLALSLSIFLLLKKKTDKKIIYFILIPAVILLIVSMVSNVNIGVRHILPLYILAFIVIGSLAKFKSMAAALLVILLIVEFILIGPYYLSFFNFISGGSHQGYKIMVDSNTDWGQDLFRIKNYIDENHIENPYVEYYWNGPSSLNYYQISHRPLSNFQYGASSGTIIIGATKLVRPEYEWLRKLPIHDKITPSVFVYKIEGAGQ